MQKRKVFYKQLTSIFMTLPYECNVCEKNAEGMCIDCGTTVCLDHWCLVECMFCDQQICIACAAEGLEDDGPFCGGCYNGYKNG